MLTASEAAQICGLSPSAMSYHLRALEKAGIVEREDSADGRERPWRAAAESLTIDRGARAGIGAATLQAYAGTWGHDLVTALERLGSPAGEDDTRSVFSRGRVWLTDEEGRELAEEIFRLWDRYKGRTRRDHPDGASLRDVYAVVLPVEDR